MTLPVLASDPDQIERAADPVAYVILACERAKAWLADALEHGQIDDIVELKSQAEAIRVYTAQKQIGKDAELSAAEIVRRAERGIGVAIRRGQEAGEIETWGESHSRAGRTARAAQLGNTEKPVPTKPRPLDYASPDELSGNGAGIYQMTDGVPDEAFEAGLADAKNEKNLTRANVVRRVQRRAAEPDAGIDLSTPAGRRARIAELAGQNYSSRQIADHVGMTDQSVRTAARDHGIEIPADKVMGRTRKHDSNRIVEETTHALDGLRMGLELVDFAALDPEKIPAWSSSLKKSIRSLNQFSRELNPP